LENGKAGTIATAQRAGKTKTLTLALTGANLALTLMMIDVCRTLAPQWAAWLVNFFYRLTDLPSAECS
jgi:hypothetical protein